jgi:hypothetical protein
MRLWANGMSGGGHPSRKRLKISSQTSFRNFRRTLGINFASFSKSRKEAKFRLENAEKGCSMFQKVGHSGFTCLIETMQDFPLPFFRNR